MNDSLTVTVAQPASVVDDVAANVEASARIVARCGARVVVFPELSLTGYQLDAEPVAPDNARLRPLVSACGAAGSVALVGAPTREPPAAEPPAAGGRVEHLSVLAVDGDGVRIVYHKMFLGADETERFRPGSEPAVITVDGWRLGLAICRDTGVAEHAERTAGLGIDAYLAGVCEHAADHEVVAERARRIAIAHRVWVAVASFAGSTGEGYDPAAGRSGIWDRHGEATDQAGPEVDRWVTATLTR